MQTELVPPLNQGVFTADNVFKKTGNTVTLITSQCKCESKNMAFKVYNVGITCEADRVLTFITLWRGEWRPDIR